jgi:hypothetical protein
MDCCDWTGTGIFRSAASTGLLRVENIAALRALRASDADNGLVVLVESLHDAFEFQQTRNAADDGITIVFQNVGPGQWARLGWKSQRWARQASWFIHPTLGNDEREGSLASAPLKTHAELRRRLNGQLLEQSVTVSLQDDLTEDVELSVGLAKPGVFLDYIGTPKQVASGTVVTFSQFNPAVGHQSPTLFAASGVGDWTPYVKKRIRFTTGPAAGRVAWIAKSISNIARLSNWPDSGGIPVSGNGYVIEDLTRVGHFRIEVSAAFAQTFSVTLRNLDLGESNNLQHALTVHSGTSLGTIADCRVGATAVDCDRATFDNCCFVGGSFGTRLCGTEITLRAGVVAGTINATSPMLFRMSGHLLLQGSGGAPVLDDVYTNVFVEDGIAVFDEMGDVIRVRLPGSVRASAPIWGQDNGSHIVSASVGAFFTYGGVSAKPTALTTHAFEVVVGSIEKTYSNIPFFNAANGAGVMDY